MANQAIDQQARPTAALGSLLVVGSGIQWAGQATLAAQRAIATADCVLFAVADAWTARWIRSLNPVAESLPYPADASSRRQIYASMVEQILDRLRLGGRVCVVFYGSPAVLTQPAHEVIRRAAQEGFAARMLPGVSFLECLFGDLGVDPGEQGCHFLDAGVFLREGRVLDTRGHVVLSQIALIRKRGVFEKHDLDVTEGLQSLSEQLLKFYPATHVCTLYEAATQPLDLPRRERVSIGELGAVRLNAVSTLYVPPLAEDNFGPLTAHSDLKRIEPIGQAPTERKEMDYLDQLQVLDQEITRAAGAPATLQALYLKRAELKIELALPTAEVDALLAHAIGKNPNVTGLSVEELGLLFDQDILNSPATFGELGIIGEAIRIYVRDDLLSQAGSKNVGRWLFRSIAAFSQGLKLMDNAPRKFRAWAHAHLGASLATLYWLAFTVHADGSPVFASAQASFQAALELGPYPWAQRFLGLLYAVRGQSGDYKRTAALLDSVAKGKDGDQASLHRSEAILYANIAWNVSGTDTPTLAEAIAAAKSGAQEGTLAGQKDPDDPLGLHFRATNVFFLYGTDQALYGDRLKLAVDSATSRSKNQFSQTCVSLASLALIQALQLSDSGSSTAAAIAEAVTRIHQLQSSGVIDLETNLLFQRDPVMQILRNNLYNNKALPSSFQPAIDALKDYDAFRMQWFVLDETILQSI